MIIVNLSLQEPFTPNDFYLLRYIAGAVFLIGSEQVQNGDELLREIKLDLARAAEATDSVPQPDAEPEEPPKIQQRPSASLGLCLKAEPVSNTQCVAPVGHKGRHKFRPVPTSKTRLN